MNLFTSALPTVNVAYDCRPNDKKQLIYPENNSDGNTKKQKILKFHAVNMILNKLSIVYILIEKRLKIISKLCWKIIKL